LSQGVVAPALQFIQNRARSILALSHSHVWRLALDIGFNRKDLCNALQRLMGQRAGQFVLQL